MSENAYERYRKRTIVRLAVNLNRNTDPDIIEWLKRQSNRTGAVKAAIREHIQFSEHDPPGIVPDFGTAES